MCPDETITCHDCNAQFLFAEGEADFYARRGLSKPKRCSPCRAKKKVQREEAMSRSSGKTAPKNDPLASVDDEAM